AEVRVARGRGGQRQLGVALALLPVRLDPVHALLGEEPARAREKRDRVEEVPCHQRDEDVELEVPLQPADGDRGVVPDDLRGYLGDDFRHDGVDLPWHDRAALLQLGQEDLREAGSRARAHQAQVVRDLRQRDGNDLERAGGLDEAVACGLCLEVVGGGRDRETGLARELVAYARRKLGMGVEPGAGGGTAERDLAEAWPHILETRRPLTYLRRIPRELLSERDGYRVHEMRPS